MNKKSSLLIFLVVLLVGCASSETSDVYKKPPMNAPSDDASMRLVEAASSVSTSLSELAEIEAAAMPPTTTGKSLPDSESYAMQSRASVDWSGPIEPLLARIARLTDFRLRILGKAPAIPVLVGISAHNKSYSDILRDAALQAGNKANIMVYSSTRVIELRYAKP